MHKTVLVILKLPNNSKRLVLEFLFFQLLKAVKIEVDVY